MTMRAALALLSWCVLWSSRSLEARNRYYFEDTVLPVGGVGEELVLMADFDVPILAFSLGLTYNPHVLRITGATIEGTDAALALDRGWFDGFADDQEGITAWGCIFAIDETVGDTALPPGVGRTLLRLSVDVLGDEGLSSDLIFDDRPAFTSGGVPVRNVLVDEEGFSIPVGLEPDALALEPGTVTIEDQSPRILELEENEGGAGDVFVILGEFLDEPDWSVTVCSQPADAEPLAGQSALLVTAPACDAPGFAEVEVCTLRGCDSVEEGFLYVPRETSFVRGDCDSDGEISGVVTDAVVLLQYNFLGERQPACLAACDADGDGEVSGSVTDAIYLLGFNFLGGPAPVPPFPDCGPGTESDALLGCETPADDCP